MATNNFNSEYDNDSVVPLQTFNDGSGLARLDDLNISSYAFDGSVPRTTVNLITASITSGMQISLTGSALGEPFYRVISNTSSDTEVEDNATGQAVIQYLDSEKNIQTITASVSDIFSVNYEDWDNKYLGTKGWYLSNDGNAIFSNVAVRGRIEATEGSLDGDINLGGSLTSSTTFGYIQISASGILGVTASGRFHLDNLDGEITFTGNVHARGGSLEYLTIGDNYFPIYNIIGSSSYSPQSFYNGAIILTIYQDVVPPGGQMLYPNSGFQYPSLTTGEIKRYMAKGDYFQLSGVTASGAAINNNDGQPYNKAQTNSILNSIWRVESASLGFVIPSTSASLLVDRYFCVRWTPFSLQNPTYNLENVSASSGSFTNGFLFSGEYNVKNGQSLTRIDGLTFSSINAGTTWNSYIPDFIDLSGRLRLANGYIRNTINTASGTTTGVYVRGSLQNMRPVQTVSASFFSPNTGYAKEPNEKIDSENVITNYIYEINPITASCVFLIAEFGLVDGDYFDVVNIGTGSIIFKTYSASIDSYLNKKVLLGKWSSATVRKRSSNSVLLSGDLS